MPKHEISNLLFQQMLPDDKWQRCLVWISKIYIVNGNIPVTWIATFTLSKSLFNFFKQVSNSFCGFWNCNAFAASLIFRMLCSWLLLSVICKFLAYLHGASCCTNYYQLQVIASVFPTFLWKRLVYRVLCLALLTASSACLDMISV